MVTNLWKQAFVVSGAALNIIGHGCVHGYPSVLFRQLVTGEDSITLDDHDVSWIGSMIGMVSLFGTFMSPVFMSRFGRQKTHIICTFPSLVGWVIFFFANSVPMFLLARVLQGISIGLRLPLAAILVAEYTDPKYRGIFLGSFAVSLAVGITLSHVIGAYLSWRMTAFACGVFPLLAMVVMVLSPESPSWLLSKGRFEEAERAFHWLRGDNIDQKSELTAMLTTQKHEIVLQERRKKQQDIETDRTLKVRFESIVRELKHFVKILKTEEFYKPFFVAVTMLVMFEFCGSHMFPAYGHVILQSVLNRKDPEAVEWQFSLLDILRTVSACIAMYLLKKFNRRTVLLVSSFMTILSMTAVSVFIYSRAFGFINDGLISDIIALTVMIVYTVSFSMGIVPLNWVICGEVFPLKYRSLGSAISTSFWVPAFFSSMKSAPHMYSSIGVEGSFLVYAGILAVCAVIMYLLLPETKDKTLQEIENSFKKVEDFDGDVEMRLVRVE